MLQQNETNKNKKALTQTPEQTLADLTLILREATKQEYLKGNMDQASHSIFQIQKLLRFEEHNRRNP